MRLQEFDEVGIAGRATREIDRQSALQQLHEDLSALVQRRLSRATFEIRWPATQVAIWEHWQQQLGWRHRCAYVDLSCLLAYYAENYETNISRLSQLEAGHCHGGACPMSADTCSRLSCQPGYLGLIYRRQRDPCLLLALLELRMSVDLRTTKWETIAELWDGHHLAFLNVVAHSQQAQRVLLNALVYTCRTVGEPALWRAYYRHLQRATYVRDQHLTRTALYLMTHLRRAERRYQLE